MKSLQTILLLILRYSTWVKKNDANDKYAKTN